MRDIIVCGGRNYNNQRRIFEVLDFLYAERAISHIHNGGARGADSLAVKWAIERRQVTLEGLPAFIGYSNHYADWRKHRRAAGPLRNARMLACSPELVVAFPGGHGTKDMIRQARKAGVPVLIVEDQP
jgi:hypothetical protein